MFKQVKKRDGNVVAFDANRIIDAVAKAFISTSELPAKEISTMASAIQVIATTALIDKGKNIPTVEEIQDEVENALIKCGYAQTAKSYILYRSQHEKARNAKGTILDYKKLIIYFNY